LVVVFLMVALFFLCLLLQSWLYWHPKIGIGGILVLLSFSAVVNVVLASICQYKVGTVVAFLA